MRNEMSCLVGRNDHADLRRCAERGVCPLSFGCEMESAVCMPSQVLTHSYLRTVEHFFLVSATIWLTASTPIITSDPCFRSRNAKRRSDRGVNSLFQQSGLQHGEGLVAAERWDRVGVAHDAMIARDNALRSLLPAFGLLISPDVTCSRIFSGRAFRPRGTTFRTSGNCNVRITVGTLYGE